MCDLKSTPFASALTNFSLNLYRQICASNAESNIFISPLSISFALAMTYAGAAGDTKKQLKKVLFGDLIEKPDEELHSLYAEVMGLLNKGDAAYKLHVANRVYSHQKFVGELIATLKAIFQKKYGSDLEPLDFGKENGNYARGVINSWVEEKTNQKIKDLIPSGILSDMTKLVLVNAIYFKGDWQTKFDPATTKQHPFYASPNKEIQVDMMNIHGKKFHYKEVDGFQVLGLPYVGKELFMFILLPKERYGLAQLENSLTPQKLLDAILEAEGDVKLDRVAIPKFKLEESVSLADLLKKLGATDMFSEEKADFSNINGQKNLFISHVLHKAFVEVNEEGTEAAAATAVVANMRCAMPQPNPSFVADHPFLFSIVDQRTTSILFLGRYYGAK